MPRKPNPVPRYGTGVGRSGFTWGNPSTPPSRYSRLAVMLKLKAKTRPRRPPPVPRLRNP